MTFTSIELKEFLNGDKEKTHNYFCALKRYIIVDTRGVYTKRYDKDMYTCVMYCKVKEALRIANIKLQSTNKRVNKDMWKDIKEFTEKRIEDASI